MTLTTEKHLRHTDLAAHFGVSLREVEQHVQRPCVDKEWALYKELWRGCVEEHFIRNTLFLF